MKKSYQLIKTFPGSPELNSIAIFDEDTIDIYDIYYNDEKTDTCIREGYITDYKEYWKELTTIPIKDVIVLNLSEKEKKLIQTVTETYLKRSGNDVELDIFNNFYTESKIRKKHFKYMQNAIGTLVYSGNITNEYRLELKLLLDKIESHYNYIYKKEDNFFIRFIKSLL